MAMELGPRLRYVRVTPPRAHEPRVRRPPRGPARAGRTQPRALAISWRESRCRALLYSHIDMSRLQMLELVVYLAVKTH